MNHCVPDWDTEDNSRFLPTQNHKKSAAHENELMELLWRNGHVVMQSQSNRSNKPQPTVPEPRHDPKFVDNSTNQAQEIGSSAWFHYDDTLDKDFSEFFSGIPNKEVLPLEDTINNPFHMPPPKFNGESSTVASSACGSNQAAKDVQLSTLNVQMSTFDPTVTSSSGGSGCSVGKTVVQRSTSNQNHKRKGRDGEDSECRSEEGDYENRSGQRSVSTRKSRAAEVHNLSERRRRDRINEKMKALQELIPHCNKSDKASMLDEAIEYLKSLQLQLQMMWMGSGMAPMMFPGVQQYMSRAGIGMGINNPIQLQRAPLLNHAIPPTASANQMPMQMQMQMPMNFSNQMQNPYIGFPHMQNPAIQGMNLYAYGSHMSQQNQTAAVAGSSSLPTTGIPSEKLQHGQSG